MTSIATSPARTRRNRRGTRRGYFTRNPIGRNGQRERVPRCRDQSVSASSQRPRPRPVDLYVQDEEDGEPADPPG